MWKELIKDVTDSFNANARLDGVNVGVGGDLSKIKEECPMVRFVYMGDGAESFNGGIRDNRQSDPVNLQVWMIESYDTETPDMLEAYEKMASFQSKVKLSLRDWANTNSQDRTAMIGYKLTVRKTKGWMHDGEIRPLMISGFDIEVTYRK